MTTANTLVWIDRSEARIFEVTRTWQEMTTVSAPTRHIHRHPPGASGEHNHPGDLGRFFDDVARALEGTSQILLVGPSSAKLQFLWYVSTHYPRLNTKIVGIETVDHPTDGQLFARARQYFGFPSPRL